MSASGNILSLLNLFASLFLNRYNEHLSSYCPWRLKPADPWPLLGLDTMVNNTGLYFKHSRRKISLVTEHMSTLRMYQLQQIYVLNYVYLENKRLF